MTRTIINWSPADLSFDKEGPNTYSIISTLGEAGIWRSFSIVGFKLDVPFKETTVEDEREVEVLLRLSTIASIAVPLPGGCLIAVMFVDNLYDGGKCFAAKSAGP